MGFRFCKRRWITSDKHWIFLCRRPKWDLSKCVCVDFDVKPLSKSRKKTWRYIRWGNKRKSYTFLTTFIEKSHWKNQSALSDVSLSFLCACSSIERFNHIYIAIALYADGNVKNWKGLCFVYRIGTNTLACVFASTLIQTHALTQTHDSVRVRIYLLCICMYKINVVQCTYHSGIDIYLPFRLKFIVYFS